MKQITISVSGENTNKKHFFQKKKKPHQSCFTGRYSMSGDLCDDLIFAFFASSYKSQIIDYA